MSVENWQCPYCGHHSVLGNGAHSQATFPLNKMSRRGENFGIVVTSYSCLNAACRELTVDVAVGPVTKNHSNARGTWYTLPSWDAEVSQRIMPIANVIALPADVPEEIKITYQEAVAVAPISGRAAAAMARRCLQGIVRDFFDIPHQVRGNLGAELSHVKEKIDPTLWSDIQTLRSVGDIGAHMDHNVNEIIDVTPDEALLLIRLIETLFREWYINRERRRQDSEALSDLLTKKREAQKAAKGRKTVPPQDPE